MKKQITFLLTLLALTLPALAFSGSQKTSGNIIVAEDEIIKGDFIRYGNVIEIEGNVQGDVVVFGSNVKISGVVGGDVLGVASNLVIEGEIFGDVRVAGSTVSVSGSVDKNVNILATTAILEKDAVLKGNTYVSAGTISIRSENQGGVFAHAKETTVSGTTEGDVKITALSNGSIHILKDAIIKGDFLYSAPTKNALVFEEGADIFGETQFTASKITNDVSDSLKGIFHFGRIVMLFGMFVIGLLFISLVPKALIQMSSDMEKHPWKNMFRGFLVILVVPVLSIVLFLTAIGIPLSLILLATYAIMIYASIVVAGIVLGMILVKKMSKGQGKTKLLWPMVIGLVVIYIASQLPFIGWVLCLAFIAWGLGGLYEFKRKEIMRWK